MVDFLFHFCIRNMTKTFFLARCIIDSVLYGGNHFSTDLFNVLYRVYFLLFIGVKQPFKFSFTQLFRITFLRIDYFQECNFLKIHSPEMFVVIFKFIFLKYLKKQIIFKNFNLSNLIYITKSSDIFWFWLPSNS